MFSAGKKAFLSIEATCGPSGPDYVFVQLDADPTDEQQFGYLVLQRNPDDEPGFQTLYTVANNDDEHMKNFCRPSSDGLWFMGASVISSDDITPFLKTHGTIFLETARGVPELTLADAWERGVQRHELEKFGFNLHPNGLIDTDSVTTQAAVQTFSDAITNPLDWLVVGGGIGVGFLILLYVGTGPVGLILLGGLALTGIGTAYVAGDRLSAHYDLGRSRELQAQSLFDFGDLQGANLALLEGAKFRGQAIGGYADFFTKSAVGFGVGKLVLPKAISLRSAKASFSGSSRPGEGTAGEGTWSPPDAPPPPESLWPTSKPGGGTTGSPPQGGMQALGEFTLIPRSPTIVVNLDGTMTVIDAPPLVLPPADLVVGTPPAGEAWTPAAPFSASSPVPLVIIPPFSNPRDENLVRYDMPSVVHGNLSTPGADTSRETIGDKPSRSKPIGDAPKRRERMGDPDAPKQKVFAPGMDNQTRFVASGEDSTRPDMNNPVAVAAWVSGRMSEIFGSDRDDIDRLRSTFEADLRGLPDSTVDALCEKAFQENDTEAIEAIAYLASAGQSHAIQKLLELAERNLDDMDEEVLDALSDHIGTVIASLRLKPSHFPDLSPPQRWNLIERIVNILLTFAEAGNKMSAGEVAMQLFYSMLPGEDVLEAEAGLARDMAARVMKRFLTANIPLPDALPEDDDFDFFDDIPVHHLAAHTHLASLRKLAQAAASGSDGAKKALREKLDFLPWARFLESSFADIVAGHTDIATIQKELLRIVRAFVQIRTLHEEERERSPEVIRKLQAKRDHIYFLWCHFIRLFARLLLQTIDASDDPDKAGKRMQVQRAIGDDDMRLVVRGLERDTARRDARERQLAAFTEGEIRRFRDKLLSQASGRHEANFAQEVEDAANQDDRDKALRDLKALAARARVRVEEPATTSRAERTGSRKSGSRAARMAAHATDRATRETDREPDRTEDFVRAIRERAGELPEQVPTPTAPSPLDAVAQDPPEKLNIDDLNRMTEGRIIFENGAWNEVSAFYREHPTRRAAFFVALRYLLGGYRVNVRRMMGPSYRGSMRITVGKGSRMIFNLRDGRIAIRKWDERSDVYRR